MNRRLFATKAAGFFAAVGTAMGVKARAETAEPKPPVLPRVRITAIHSNFMFDTDFQGIKYEVVHPDGEKVEKHGIFYRDNSMPLDLDLS